MSEEQDRREQITWRKMSREAKKELADFEAAQTAAGLKRLRAIPDEEWQRAVDLDGRPEAPEGTA